MFGFIKKRLGYKIMAAIIISASLVMGAEIYVRTSFGIKDRIELMTTAAMELASSTYAGIKHPMSIGDSEAIKKQLSEIREKTIDVEVFISDPEQLIIYSTHEDKVNTRVGDSIYNKAAQQTLVETLKTGVDPKRSFVDEVSGKRYLVTIYPILNQEGCYHCHGPYRKVLGSLITKIGAEHTYATIVAQRNRTLVLAVFGISLIITLTYFMMTKLVSRPIENLAGKAKRLAEGDMSVSADVKTEDEIGVLGNSFNYMVTSIKDQIEYANSIKDAICDPLFIVDNNMIVTYMNDACVRLTGYEKAEVEGKMNCEDLFKSDICESKCPVRYCFDKREPVEGIRSIITNRQGIQIPTVTSASPLRDAHGGLIGAIEILKDITDVLEAENLRYIKKTAEREEEQRRYLEERGENLLNILTRVSKGNLNVNAEVLGSNDVMDKIAVSVNSMIVQLSKAKKELVDWGHTLEKKVEEKSGEIQRAQAQLIHSAKLASLGRMAAGVAHEINNPLTGIMTFAYLLLENFPEGSPTREDINVIIEQATRCSNIIKGLLGFARARPAEKGLLNVNEVLNNSLGIIQRKADFFNIKLIPNLDENLPPVKADASQLQQVFLNMILNAVDAMEGQGTLTICTRKVTENGEPFAEVEFTDTGHGISVENMAKLFEPFFTTKPVGKGTGLGLAVSHGIIQEHGGKILVKSKIGEGTSFFVRLPFYDIQLVNATGEVPHE